MSLYSTRPVGQAPPPRRRAPRKQPPPEQPPPAREPVRKPTTVVSTLEPLQEEALVAISHEDRRAEAYRLYLTGGMTLTKIGERFGVTRFAVSQWIAAERAERITRREQIDDDIEDMVEQCQSIIAECWKRLQNVAPHSMTGPTLLKTVLEATDRVVMLRGLDKEKIRAGGRTGRTVINVSIGSASPVVVDAEAVEEVAELGKGAVLEAEIIEPDGSHETLRIELEEPT